MAIKEECPYTATSSSVLGQMDYQDMARNCEG